ncbi:MAG: 6-phosphogluconate dehydrogenase-like protein [Desertimonas sp.]|nr:6-phosphogluconate dehydrogenase-like protein [Desertimonas sp.]
MHVTVFGLGEAGALLAADLSTAGVDVTGFDPAPVATPEGVARSPDAAAAVADADIVLIVTGAPQAADVFDRIVAHLPADCLVADLSTSAPDAKAARAASAAAADRSFVDVALMAPVPGRGLGTPSLASGAGAERYGAAMRPLGAPVELVGERAGAASTRKLLRSVTMKGLASVVIEALRAAERAGFSDWLWSDLVAEFESADEALLRRLVHGTGVHARRRVHEMEASAEMLDSLGIEPLMTRATIESLRVAARDGVPVVPNQAKS